MVAIASAERRIMNATITITIDFTDEWYSDSINIPDYDHSHFIDDVMDLEFCDDVGLEDRFNMCWANFVLEFQEFMELAHLTFKFKDQIGRIMKRYNK